MKADGKLYLEEIKFCSKVAAKLGYNEAVMYDLITEVYSDYQQYDKSWQKQKVQEYLRKWLLIFKQSINSFVSTTEVDRVSMLAHYNVQKTYLRLL